jgi:hypothetical protein
VSLVIYPVLEYEIMETFVPVHANNKIVYELIEALGLPPIVSLNISINSDEFVELTIVSEVSEKSFEKAVSVIKKYKLVEIVDNVNTDVTDKEVLVLLTEVKDVVDRLKKLSSLEESNIV